MTAPRDDDDAFGALMVQMVRSRGEVGLQVTVWFPWDGKVWESFTAVSRRFEKGERP